MTGAKTKDLITLEPHVENILAERYYLKDENWPALCRRVATALFPTDEETREKVYQMFLVRDSIMASPTLMNAGARLGMLSSCFIYPIHDSLDGIFETLRLTARTFKMGGGAGADFSPLRPAGAVLMSTGGKSSGPISFMENFNSVGVSVSGGGLRKAAQLAALRIDHPDIEDFTSIKTEALKAGNEEKLSMMNLSVASTELFFRAMMFETDYPNNWFYCDKPNEWKMFELDGEEPPVQEPDLHYRRGKDGLWILNWRNKIFGKIVSANTLFRQIAEAAHSCGCPGLIFIDEVNKYNYVPNIGEIRNPNPCLHGDTLISVADGRGAVPIRELAERGEDVQLYTLKGDGSLGISWGIHPRKTGNQVPIVKVTLDDGSVYRVTPNHVFILRDGREVEAKDLKYGDRLHHVRILKTTYDEVFNLPRPKGRRALSQYWWASLNGSPFFPEHRLVFRDLVEKTLDNDYVIHHADFNPLNNCIENLIPMEKDEHRRFHAERMKGKNNPYHRCFTDKQKLEFATHIGEANGMFIHVSDSDLREHAIFLLRKFGRITRGLWMKQIYERGLNGKIPMISSGNKINGIPLGVHLDRIFNDDEINSFASEYDDGWYRRPCVCCGKEIATPWYQREIMYCSNKCKGVGQREILLSNIAKGMNTKKHQMDEKLNVALALISELAKDGVITKKRFIFEVQKRGINGLKHLNTKLFPYQFVDLLAKALVADETNCSILREHAKILLNEHGRVTTVLWNKLIKERGVEGTIPVSDGRVNGVPLDALVCHLLGKDVVQQAWIDYQQERKDRHDRSNCYYQKRRIEEKLNVSLSLISELALNGKVTRKSFSKAVKERGIKGLSVFETKLFPYSFADLRKMAMVSNHRVVSVESDGFADVYNITVEKTHKIVISTYLNDEKTQLNSIVTSQCGEALGPAYFSCNLASINLNNFCIPKTEKGWEWNFDWHRFEVVTRLMTRCLDQVVSINKLPSQQTTNVTQAMRPLGLGFFGTANVLIRMGLKYSSEEGRRFVAELSEKMTFWSMDESVNIAKENGEKKEIKCLKLKPKIGKIGEEDDPDGNWKLPLEKVFESWSEDEPLRGSFPAIKGSVWDFEGLDFAKQGNQYSSREFYEDQLRGKGNHFAANMIAFGSLPLNEWIRLFRRIQQYGIRNCHNTFFMPTGTVSYICNSTESSGIEPLFTLKPVKRRIAGTDNKGLTTLNEVIMDYPSVVIEYAERVLGIKKIDLQSGKINLDQSKLPPYFEFALSISPENHVRMMAAAQQFVHVGVSKTINMPESATVDDVLGAYKLAYKLGCKGITIYRDHSKSIQIVDLQTMATTKRLIPKAQPKLPLAELEEAAVHRVVDPDAYTNGHSDSSLYVVVTLLKDGVQRIPIEIFIKFDHEAKEASGSKASLRNIICRLASNMLRRGIPITDVIKNLEAPSRGFGDFGSILAKILRFHLAEMLKDVDDKDIPKIELDIARPKCLTAGCDGRLVFQDGCYMCPVCGTSKC